MLQAGIVGLPSVAKAHCSMPSPNHGRQAANYPFCTIDERRVVLVPDSMIPWPSRQEPQPSSPQLLKWSTSPDWSRREQGEGLGNKFLASVREVDAIVQVVRCFEDEGVIRAVGRVDPIRDAEVIMTELVLADAESVASQLQKNLSKARGNDKDAAAIVALVERLIPHLDEGKPANLLEMDEDEKTRLKTFFLLSGKPMLYACNLNEVEIATPDSEPLFEPFKKWADSQQDAIAAASAKMEEELSELSDEDAKEYLDAGG